MAGDSAIGHILCPIDVARPPRAAVRYAFVLADWFGAGIDALHVADGAVRQSPAFGVRSATEVARQKLQSIVERSETGVPVTWEATEGGALRVILDRARSHRSDLIVLGAKAARGPSFQRVTGLAEGLASEAVCPVLTVPERCSDGIVKRILLPVDFSDATDAAIHWASVIANRFDASIDVLHALAPASPDAPRMLESAKSLAGIAGAAKRLQSIERRLRDSGVRATSNVIVEASTLQAILALSKPESYELLVLGMHERNPFEVGHGAATIATLRRRASIPVLSVLKPRSTLLFTAGVPETAPAGRKLEIAS